MYSKGISWIDDCRIPFVDEKVVSKMYNDGYDTFTTYLDRGNVKTDYEIQNNTQGRFPANLLVCDDTLNDGVYHKTGIAKLPKGKKIYRGNSLQNTSTEFQGGYLGAFGEKGGSNSRYYDIDKWFDKILND